MTVESCSNCDIAWLYKDAHRFGLKSYRNLIGNNNLLCQYGDATEPDVPFLDNDKPEFLELMKSCPDTGTNKK